MESTPRLTATEKPRTNTCGPDPHLRLVEASTITSETVIAVKATSVACQGTSNDRPLLLLFRPSHRFVYSEQVSQSTDRLVDPTSQLGYQASKQASQLASQPTNQPSEMAGWPSSVRTKQVINEADKPLTPAAAVSSYFDTARRGAAPVALHPFFE